MEQGSEKGYITTFKIRVGRGQSRAAWIDSRKWWDEPDKFMDHQDELVARIREEYGAKARIEFVLREEVVYDKGSGKILCRDLY